MRWSNWSYPFCSLLLSIWRSAPSSQQIALDTAGLALSAVDVAHDPPQVAGFVLDGGFTQTRYVLSPTLVTLMTSSFHGATGSNCVGTSGKRR